jgi:D-alanyl-D-alanine carboxypeptidase (penicillin-binding protein 5/6)
MRIRAVLAIALSCLLAWAAVVAVRLNGRHVDDRPVRPTQDTSQTQQVTADAAMPWPDEGQAAVEVEGVGALGSSGVHGPVPIASLAKIMTAYLVLKQDPLEDGDGGFTVTFQDKDVQDFAARARDDQSVVGVQAGEVMDERQLLEALLLPSANNIAVVLAVHEAGSVDEFVHQMNETADHLGMPHTTYTDPSGLDRDTVSTAPDQLRLVRAALSDRTFAGIVRLQSTSLPLVGEVQNTNPLLRDPGFVGVKTGSDDAAGGCLAFATVGSVGGHDATAVGVVLGQRGGPLIDAAARAARALATAAFAAAASGPAG